MPERLTTSLSSLGSKVTCVVCRSTSVAPLTPTYHLWSPTGDKPWYLHRGKTVAALHLKPSTWGNQRRARSHHVPASSPCPPSCSSFTASSPPCPTSSPPCPASSPPC